MATTTAATTSFPHLQFGQTVGPRDENSPGLSVLSWIEVFQSDGYHRILEDSHIDRILDFVRSVVIWKTGTHSTVMGWAHGFAQCYFKHNPLESINYSKNIPDFEDLEDDKAQEKAKQKHVSDLLFSWFSVHFSDFHPVVAHEDDMISPRLRNSQQATIRQFMEAYLCWVWHHNRGNWDGRLLARYRSLAAWWWAPADALKKTIDLIEGGNLLPLFDIDAVELVKQIATSIEEVESTEKGTQAGKFAQDKLSWFLKLFVIEYFTHPSKFDFVRETLNNGVINKDAFIKHLEEAIPTWEICGVEIYPRELPSFLEVVRFCRE